MADYVDGDEQLQDAFDEGNGDANNDEVCGRRVLAPIWPVTLSLLPSLRLYGYMLCSGAYIYASQISTTRRRKEKGGGAHCTS